MKFELNDYHRNISDEEFIQDIRSVFSKLITETLLRDEYNKHGKYHSSTISKRFGSWIQALEKAGIAPANFQRTNIPDKEFIDDLIRVARLLNKNSVTTGAYKVHGRFDCGTILHRFDSWSRFLELSKLESTGFKKDITNEDLLHEIESVWIALGRQPTTTDIKDGCSKYSLNTFTRRFGSWRKALEVFVEYINQETETEAPDDELSNGGVPRDMEVGIVRKHKTVRDIGDRLRFRIMKRDSFKCRICGNSPAINPGITLHVDHIVPWSKGGETVPENLQILCSRCNLGKSDLEII